MNNRSFTLIELVIVLSILAILASAAVSTFIDISNKALNIQENSTINGIRAGILLYKAKYDAWPDGNAFGTDWNPFMVLDNPPANERSNCCNGTKWCWNRDQSGPNPPNPYFWHIMCPHSGVPGCFNPGEPLIGWQWVYFPTSGRDFCNAWRSVGSVGKFHNCGAAGDYVGH
jgi:prepilin-type N-terminal cleavage/methylation domain-containing protein